MMMKKAIIALHDPDRKQFYLFLVAAAVIPAIFNYYYYCNNASAGISFYHTTGFSLICATINVTFFLVASRFIRKPASLLISFLLWLSFWGFIPINRVLGMSYHIGRVQTIICFVILITAVSLGLSFIKFNVLAGNVIAAMLCTLFVFNFTQGCFIALAKAPMSNSHQDSLTKSSFFVDENLPKPDVIWIHADGMLSFSTVEKFFGDSQEELKIFLNTNGFLINEDARLNTGSTDWGVPSLISPYLYDAYLGDALNSVANVANIVTRISLLDKKFNEDKFNIRNVWNRQELFLAFMQADYRANGGFLPQRGYYPIDLYYAKDSSSNIYLMQKEDVIDDAEYERILNYCTYLGSLADFTPVQIFRKNIELYVDNIIKNMDSIVHEVNNPIIEVSNPIINEEDTLMIMLNDLLHLPSPQISYVYMSAAHFPFNRDENGELLSPTPKDDAALENYWPQHIYAGKCLMKMIDLIIKENPEAVIVIQADHGIHTIKNGKYIKEGYSEEQVLELLTSVISAVRIPPQYGTLSEPLDPLDISRWIINHFVGKENYSYLYYQDIDQ